MSLVRQQNLETLVRTSFHFNRIDQSNARHFEVLFNTIVVYGSDHDTRVLEFIQRLKPSHLVKLVMVQLIDDNIFLFWNTTRIPAYYAEGKTVKLNYADGDADIWKVQESRTIHDIVRVKERILINISLN